MIELDGSHGEGGGQIVRTALALSTLIGKSVKIINIRSNREISGLKNQHMFAIKALQELCSADVKGAELGSTEIIYAPGKIESKTISIDIKTAGSITLLLQAIIMPCLFADKPIRIKIVGGTDVRWSMPSDYFMHVFLPQMRRYANVDFKLKKRGYYPKGSGEVDIKIRPRLHISDVSSFDKFTQYIKANTEKINLVNKSKILAIKGISHASENLAKAQVAERQTQAAKRKLSDLDVSIDIDSVYGDTLSSGSGMTLWAICSNSLETDYNNPIIVGSDSLGQKGKRAEIVGQDAAQRLIDQLGSPVDVNMGDNLIPYIAMFGGSIKVSKISSHTRTNIYVCEKMLDRKIQIDEKKRIIRC